MAAQGLLPKGEARFSQWTASRPQLVLLLPCACTFFNRNRYNGFQQRIMYGTYKLVQKMPGGERLTGFTRILHGTTPDILMDEVRRHTQVTLERRTGPA